MVKILRKYARFILKCRISKRVCRSKIEEDDVELKIVSFPIFSIYVRNSSSLSIDFFDPYMSGRYVLIFLLVLIIELLLRILKINEPAYINIEIHQIIFTIKLSDILPKHNHCVY